MGTVSIQIPDDLDDLVTAQAERAGLSLHEYLLFAVVCHVGSQAEVKRWFAARATRSSGAQALEVLSRVGQDNPPEPGDKLPSNPAQ